MASKTKVLLIDNYDSFTWNIYEYLCQEGADVEVFRNDKITVEEIEAKNPDIIFISPGPGHPKTDAGVSIDTIHYFKGKKPIVGVCMGQQCMYEAFGGTVGFAGEIVHGKSSPVKHDGKGLFDNIAQDVEVTRYHSLAGTRESLPECLEITAETHNGVIMGVRHKEYVIEGVQFHPEGILTDDGRTMISNVLKFRGGTWADKKSSEDKTPAQTSILQRIYAQRKADVDAQKKIPGQSFEDLQKSLPYAPKLIDVKQRLLQKTPAMMAEIKRASPSKGPIDLQAHAPTQALIYANAGASAISVLTEPHWFKGSLEDMRLVRLAVDSLENRPAILRKEFIFDRYQILEARLNGADTVLLIVKMLDDELLADLYKYSKSLGMEPLVEVASLPEMERANRLNAQLIGVNNRDLHSFNVDLNTTSSVMSLASEDIVIAALSGITCKADVEKYVSEGVKAVLVGEALMRAKDTSAFVKELIG
ncbi:indole-3-glycerol phosphate synthase-domain-containing protein [Yarrowia lipolytica]|uniref:Multifunctional tryptophan biosynthesis protein n=2 Tax=Yarrowia lipolytica TaxID=4952 RepID=Q6C9H7_YARLI|nr:YALI0D11110p [Yarrowia lipolytica CLIB122]AOW03909.1 hypothetical protein YALI1_D13963g [Yarrowia lipolytica]KAB8283036.1 indole-3-glycerol phosphate synthase-domain-containing protein [Yarrowia lipolytica]KAE8172402.1 indole-3-glycerol phosphate synthase-domain-containing protein [Yarrowia lipolytica]KAJ8054523.1 indole-3-glycerol phosphate synthase-domain-containing protein [Yarrowia lipolytica]QNP98454.1 Multifunctional tryptophan biosynthesis protein [Yarrowia lipolytica]|eukprot:XP_502685.1 YALI0D11110p [Yarrowia lipolytica CLIB122]